MRRLLISLLLILFKTNPGQALTLTLTEEGIVRPEVIEILKELGYKGKKDIFSVNEYAQTHLLRPPGKERWDLQDHSVSDARKKKVRDTFNKLGILSEKSPSYHDRFDHILILGATVNRMRERVSFLKDQINKGLKYKKIYFLTGERPLDPAQENDSALFALTEDQSKYLRKKWKKSESRPATESAAARLVWDQVMPATLPGPVFIDTPMSGTKRPTTSDTIATWLKTNPEQGRVLAISNNPFISYQHTVILQSLLEGQFLTKSQFYLLETVGSGANPDKTGYHVSLDNLARTLYSETQITLRYHRLCSNGSEDPLSDKHLKEIHDVHESLLNHQNLKHKPFFIAFSGTQAMGKSHLSRQLEKRLQATRFSTNVMRSIMIQKEIPATRCHTHQYAHFFYCHHLTKTRNNLLILDTSVDKTWPKIKSFLYERNIPYFLIRLEIPRPQVMKQLMERNDFGILWSYMDQYFLNHQNLGKNYSEDFDITLNESFFLSENEIRDLCSRIRKKIDAYTRH